MDIWSWLCNLPSTSTDTCPDGTVLQSLLRLASSKDEADHATKSILLKAERKLQSAGSSEYEDTVTFSICHEGFSKHNLQTPLWISSPCLLSSKPFISLLLQVLEQVLKRAPAPNFSTLQLMEIDRAAIAHTFNTQSPELLSSVFDLIFLCHLFWLCAVDAPSEVGSMYFSKLESNADLLTNNHAIKMFMVAIGPDVELYFMRSIGYILSKWLILRELQLRPLTTTSSPPLSFSFAGESHGLWVLKGYTPVLAMERTGFHGQQDSYTRLETKESLLRYTLGHQQLEAVIQLDYKLSFFEGYVQIHARIDNIRLHVARLGFGHHEKENEYSDERHFPSRVQVWVGPEFGSRYASGLCLGRSTCNIEREVETRKVVKGTFGSSKFPKVKAAATTSVRTRMRSWRWDQDVEGNTAVFVGVLCDNVSGAEVAAWRPASDEEKHKKWDPKRGLRGRYSGACRGFNKSGSVVFGGDEYGEEVSWRMGKEVVGRILKWRLGGKVWLSYWPNELNTTYFETRCIEWCEEVELPLLRGK